MTNHPGELLSAYLDGELDPGEQRTVLDHLGGCAACQAELGGLDAARSAVRSLPMLEPPPFVLAPDPVAAVVPLRHRWSVRIAAAAAAAIVGVASVGAVRGNSDAAPFDVDSAVEQHINRFLVDPGVTGVQVVSVVARR